METFDRDLLGEISAKFRQGNSFNMYCTGHIPGFDPSRFEAFALRVYYGKEIIATVYAVDKTRPADTQHVPVKKFKMGVPFLKGLFPYMEEFNFTVTTGAYPLESMEVINK